VGVAALATVIFALYASMPEKLVLTLKQDDEHGGYKEVEFTVGESLDSVYRNLAENFIDYTVDEQKDLAILSCFGLDHVNYRIFVCSGKVDRIEAESYVDGRGIIIPTRYRD